MEGTNRNLRDGLHFCAEVGSTFYHPISKIAKDNALHLINMAKWAGADSVKFQLFSADTLYNRDRAPEIHEKIKKFELPVEWLPDMRVQADRVGIQLWFSFFSLHHLKSYAHYADGIKVASGDLTNKPLIKLAAGLAAAYNVPLAISTGAALSHEVHEARKFINPYMQNIPKFIVYHCKSAYPANPKIMNLRGGLYSLRVTGAVRGLSDHTHGSLAAQLALASGGYSWFEKHFKSTHAFDNPDNVVALTPPEFRNYINHILLAKEIMGTTDKIVHPDEADERKWARRGKDGLRPVPDEELD